ncbi:hypothetical protein SAMN05216421_3148 [Halopseudomonas xinjiangensis]|uniref:Uncharacterized protein n=1 Tax=Halopseudomonas xinjiangensis TaxID=487184 RepID=A0A1H1YGG1_9GAMM|nr:hypothetical protein [Halopseudomonas xinjiangensis]SDT20517.1 hypothetical protein SAMN05216421_3148 [Halopseudomonas xinjiangensis]
MSNTDKLRIWEFGIAVVGFLAWMLLISTSEQIRELGVPNLYKFVSGYILGFVIAFAGFMFWEVLRGRAHQFLDDSLYFRWISYITLLVILLLGGASLIAQIFGDTNWAYNVGSLLGGIAVGVGVVPTSQRF